VSARIMLAKSKRTEAGKPREQEANNKSE